MATEGAKLKLLQANLESMVQQLDAKTKEAAAATQEVATQKALVQQITKKLDVSAAPLAASARQRLLPATEPRHHPAHGRC